MKWLERATFREMLLREHVGVFGRVYFCQISLDGIDYAKVRLHAHHIFPVAIWPDKRLDITNGVLIRDEHHLALHQGYSLEQVPWVLKDYVAANYNAYCKWYRNLILPNGRRFPEAWTAFLISKSLLDKPSKMFKVYSPNSF